MKTFKEIMREQGLDKPDTLEIVQKLAKKRENEFKNKLKKACNLAGISFEEVKVQTGDSYFELRIPLKKLIGPATRQFCADRWDSFFEQAGIKVNFRDNIDAALNSIDLLVPLKFDKNSFKEI